MDPAQKTLAAETSRNGTADSEWMMPIWSVISFDKVEASGLSYADAAARLAELEAEGVNGLCVVDDDAAARMPA